MILQQNYGAFGQYQGAMGFLPAFNWSILAPPTFVDGVALVWKANDMGVAWKNGNADSTQTTWKNGNADSTQTTWKDFDSGIRS